MRRTLTIIATCAGLFLAGCGSDTDGASELAGPQADAARSAIDSAAADGVELDESCVNEIAAQLTDDDAVLAAADGDADLSPAGEELTVQLLTCADEDVIVDLFISELSQSGVPLDEDCAREQIERFDVIELFTTLGNGEDPPQDFVDALTPCFEG